MPQVCLGPNARGSAAGCRTPAISTKFARAAHLRAGLGARAAPPGLPSDAALALFRQALPAHQQAPGLLRKYFTVVDDGTLGGIYLWRDEASARAWFSADWHASVQRRAGAPASIEWFDVPILTPTQDAANAVPAGAMITATP